MLRRAQFRRAAAGLAVLMACASHQALAEMGGDDAHSASTTTTPIQHLIVIVGENHTFDNLFGGYRPRHGQRILNLLSEGIIKPDGSPGAYFARAAQQQAEDYDVYRLAPNKTAPYATLPQPNTTYATGLPPNQPDARFPADLPNGPFQITKYVNYDAHTGDPAHRFFQMWQQYDKGHMDLFTWVGKTVSIGPDNGSYAPSPADTFQGGVSMGFYNMSTGDAPYFKSLADHYAISDNYHQAIMGGTGANFIALVTGDVAYYNVAGYPTMPPVNQIENPDPQPGSNNWYTRDGYQGGSYVNCSDTSQPGVAQIRHYLHSVKGKPFRNGNCAPDTYYLVNNYGLGYTKTGDVQPLGPTHYTLPPQTVPTIAEALASKGVSWKWYSGGRNGGDKANEYCTICDPLVAFTGVMTSGLKNDLQGMTQFYADVQNEKTMPAVAFIRPYESQAGHPANATMSGFEHFVEDVIKRVQSNKKLWAHTAILVTTDEGGGYYDSGYIQPIDFFGDGTRIPMIAVSPFARHGYVDHTYYDHASILKFIERNWSLGTLSQRSRDNLPNPVMSAAHPYVPENRPAIGDLMNLFRFGHKSGHAMHHASRREAERD